MNVEIFIEGKKISLFETDGISITQSVQDVKDISKIFSDFSQTFAVPADNNNNQIFSHYYNADITNGFDARIRVDGYINVNTIPFKRGKFRLDSVKIKNGVAQSYRITFFGNAIKIKDLIGDDKLNNLDWLSNFNHEYSGDVVKTGLTQGLDFTVDGTLYEKAIVYPLISYQRQYLYNSDSTDTTSTETLVNIAYDAGRTDGVKFSELKPSIKAELILQAITEKYGITFNSSFFESQRFKNIHVNLNRTTESLANGNFVVEDYEGSFSSDLGINIEYLMQVTPLAGFEDVPYKIRLTVNGLVAYESANYLTGFNYVTTGDNLEFSQDYEVKAEVITESDFEFNANTFLRRIFAFAIVEEIWNEYLGLSINLEYNILNELPDIKVYDFLTDLFKTFNLTAFAEGDDIRVEDLQSWYASGQIYDITKYVSTEAKEVERGKIYREINFNFEESEQIIYNEFLQSNGLGYGDLEFKLTDENGNNIDGDVLDIQVLFENPIHERLFDLNDNSQTSIQYTPYFDRDFNRISGGMFMFYPNLVNANIGFVNDNVYEQINAPIFIPSHSEVINSDSFALNFNAEINEYTYSIFEDTIFKEYYEDYITDIFSVKRRLYRYEGVLPLNLLHNLKLNDRLVINNRRYIINRITSNIVNRLDDLELINDIYEAPLVSDSLNTSLFRQGLQSYGVQGGKGSNVYYGSEEQNITLIDEGFGTSWVTLERTKTTSEIDTINYTVDVNDTGSYRGLTVRVADGAKFIIRQKGIASFDSTITFDNTNITFDNNG